MSGCCSDITNQPRVNNINRMRQAYFVSIPTRHFDFELAESFYTEGRQTRGHEGVTGSKSLTKAAHYRDSSPRTWRPGRPFGGISNRITCFSEF